MAKKTKAAAQDPLRADIFSQMGDDGADEGSDEPQAGSMEAKMAALEAKIEAQQREIARFERTNAALMASPGTFVAPGTVAAAPAAQEPDLSGLPDPTLDPEGYHKAVTKRITEGVMARVKQDQDAKDAQMAEQQAAQGRAEALWEQFEERYPHLAPHRDLVEAVAASVANKARTRGMDLQRYIFGATEQYLEDVASEMDKKYGKAIKAMAAEEGEEEPAGRQPEGAVPNRELAARTMGITGGMPTSGAAPKGKDTTAQNEDFVSDLVKFQRAAGLI